VSTGRPVEVVGLLPKYDRLVMIFRDARREDVPAIVALLADDELGAEREASVLDEAYHVAFEQIQSDPRSRLVAAETSGQVAGTLQLSLLPGLSRHGMLRAQTGRADCPFGDSGGSRMASAGGGCAGDTASP
jgi:hypothetical protein